MPVIGMIPVVIPIFTMVCPKIIAATPTATSRPTGSCVDDAITRHVPTASKYNPKIATQPRNPH